MTYAFVLGRVYTLSVAEIIEVLHGLYPDVQILEASLEVLVVTSESSIDFEGLQKRLGGIIKILKIVDTVKKREQDSINFALQNYFKPGKIKNDFLKNTTGKIHFGISVYLLDMNIRAFGEPKRLGMFIKRAMQDYGASIRLVVPEYNSLAIASVSVTHNQLLSKGAEICVIADTTKVYIAKTLSVQDFEDYGRRDYQRPARDEQRGMIPPKVAQIMLNLTGVKRAEVLLDPFCGVGTFIQEGALLDYKMVGTDKDEKAILASEKNLEWFRNRYKVSKGRYHLDAHDARKVSEFITHLQKIKAITQIAGVVTEGTLGPLYSSLPSGGEIEENFNFFHDLYSAVFKDFSQFLPSGAPVVMCLPAYRKAQDEYILIPSLDFALQNGYNTRSTIPQEILARMPFLKLTPRGSAIYDRKDQVVAREIVIFKKV